MSELELRQAGTLVLTDPAVPAVPGHKTRDERIADIDAERERRLAALQTRWEAGRAEINMRWTAYLGQVAGENREHRQQGVPGMSLDDYGKLSDEVEKSIKAEQEQLKAECTAEMSAITSWRQEAERKASWLEDWQIDMDTVDHVEAVRGVIRAMAGTETILARHKGQLIEVMHELPLPGGSPVSPGVGMDARPLRTASALMELFKRVEAEHNAWFFWRWSDVSGSYEKTEPSIGTLRVVMSDPWWTGLPELADLAGTQNNSVRPSSPHPAPDQVKQVRASGEALTSGPHFPTMEMLRQVLPFEGPMSAFIAALGVSCNERNMRDWLAGPGRLAGVVDVKTPHRRGKNRLVVHRFGWAQQALPPGS